MLAQMSDDEVAYGFIKVANEAMCRPIRVLTQARGFDTKTHVLSCFGGAGAQHGTAAPGFLLACTAPADADERRTSPIRVARGPAACAIARSLGIRRVYIHRHCSILSAYGIALADVVREKQVPCNPQCA